MFTSASRLSHVFTPPVTHDPFFANVVLLLHCDGPNNSTTITDVKGATITKSGNPKISTLQSRFGGASLLFDAASYIVTPVSSSYGLGTGDFTIEASFFTGNPGKGTQGLIDMRASGGGSSQMKTTILTGPNQLSYQVAGTTVASTSISANTWYTFALSRVSGTTYFFVNGVRISSTADTNDYGASNDVIMGEVGDNRTFNAFADGYMDEVRITKGVGRYTNNYSIATSPFPNNS